MSNEHQNAKSIGIIGSADGPTSVFIGGNHAKLPLSVRIKNRVYKYRRKMAEKRIVPGGHTLEELVAYAAATYGATETDRKPEETPASSRIYEIKVGDSCLEMEVDDTRDTFGVSYSGSKQVLKQLRKITKDLYLYYGVSEHDIRNRTERYFALLGVLSI